MSQELKEKGAEPRVEDGEGVCYVDFWEEQRLKVGVCSKEARVAGGQKERSLGP